MLIEEKNDKITKYILEQIDTLNKEYEDIVPKDRVNEVINKFLNSDMEYDTLVKEFNELSEKMVEEYKKNIKNKKVKDYILKKAEELNTKYEGIAPSDKVDNIIEKYKNNEKEYDEIIKDIDQEAINAVNEYKNEKVKAYLMEKAEDLNVKYPGILPSDKVDKAIEEYKDSEKEYDDIIKEIDGIITKSVEEYKKLEKIKNHTFDLIKLTFIKLKMMLANENLKLFLAGGTVPYFLLNEDSNRMHGDIDTICDMKDISTLRQIFIQNGLYIPEWDSLGHSKDQQDYGFEIVIDGVPVGIYPFIYENGKITQRSFDPYTKECKEKVLEVKEITDYVNSYKSKDGNVYDTMSLEYIKLIKDSSKMEKDIIDSKKIDETNMIRPDVLNRIQMYKVVDVSNRDSFNKRSEKEIDIANDIREKNKAIVMQKQEVKQNVNQNEKGKQKVLLKPNDHSGFANAISLALIVGFFAGILCSIMFIFINRV